MKNCFLRGAPFVKFFLLRKSSESDPPPPPSVHRNYIFYYLHKMLQACSLLQQTFVSVAGDAMLPRISVRRCFLYSSAICLSLIVVVNLTPGPPASLTVLLPQSDQSASGSSNLFNAIQSNNKHQPQRNQHHSDNVAFQKTQRKPAQEQVR